MSEISFYFVLFESSLAARVLAGGVFLVLFAWLFFRTTRGAGISLFLLLSVLFGGLFTISPAFHLLAFIPLVLLVALNEWRLSHLVARYHPAVAIVEGGGIRRGLQPAEAAVLLEKPVNVVLMSVMVSLLQKGVWVLSPDDPFQVALADPLHVPGDPADIRQRAAQRRRAAQLHGVVLQEYEEPFIEILAGRTYLSFQAIQTAVPLKGLIKHAAERVRGYDLPATRQYYQQVVQRARLEAESANGSADLYPILDRLLAWILLDDGTGKRFERAWAAYRPPWLREMVGWGAEDQHPMSVARPFSDWISGVLQRTAASLGPEGLRVRTPTGLTLSLSGEDPLSTAFFDAVTAG